MPDHRTAVKIDVKEKKHCSYCRIDWINIVIVLNIEGEFPVRTLRSGRALLTECECILHMAW